MHQLSSGQTVGKTVRTVNLHRKSALRYQNVHPVAKIIVKQDTSFCFIMS